MSYSLSLVVPGFNEEENIAETIGLFRDELSQICDRWEIIIVDDASTDRTGEIADELAARSPEIRVIHNRRNLGVGASLLVGLREAKCDLITHNSMDRPFDVRDLRRLLPMLDGVDVLVVARRALAAHPPFKRAMSLVNRALRRMLFDVKVTDMNFVQVYRRHVLSTLQVTSRSPAFVTPELIIRASRAGFRLKQVTAEFHPRLRGTSKNRSLRVIVWSFVDMWRFWAQSRFGR